METEMLEHLAICANFLQLTMYVSFIHLLFPLNQIFEWYFTKQTNRKPTEIGVNFFNELCLFVIMIIWIRDYYGFEGEDPENKIQRPGMTTD